MTNFEWLAKKCRLEGFLHEIAEKGTDLENIVVYDKFAEKWGLPNKIYVPTPIYNFISDWLEEEHKAREYVLLEDVVSLLNKWFSAGNNGSIDIEPTLRQNLKVREINE